MFEEDFIWYPIYNNEFEKSTLLTDIGELGGDFYIDEDGVKRRRKGHNLKNLEISEISLCRAGKVNVKYLIQKGDDEVNKSDNFRWSDNLQRIVRGYAESDLEEDFGYEEELEKSSDTNPFPSLARIFNNNKRILEEVYEEATVQERLI